jgi:hypothetical protein
VSARRGGWAGVPHSRRVRDARRPRAWSACAPRPGRPVRHRDVLSRHEHQGLSVPQADADEARVAQGCVDELGVVLVEHSHQVRDPGPIRQFTPHDDPPPAAAAPSERPIVTNINRGLSDIRPPRSAGFPWAEHRREAAGRVASHRPGRHADHRAFTRKGQLPHSRLRLPPAGGLAGQYHREPGDAAAPRQRRPGPAAVLPARTVGRSCRSIDRLHQEIRGRGYRGSLRTLRRHTAQLRKATARPAPPPAPPAKKVASWILTPPGKLTDADHAALTKITARCQEINVTCGLVREFAGMLCHRKGSILGAWAASAEASPVPELRGFAKGLRKDWAAVTAGLTLPYSSGVVEGHVCRKNDQTANVRTGQTGPPTQARAARRLTSSRKLALARIRDRVSPADRVRGRETS